MSNFNEIMVEITWKEFIASMKLRIHYIVVLLFQVLFFFSCTRAQNDASGSHFFNKIHQKISPFKDSKKNIVSGVWINQWFNQDGYRVTEFLSIDSATKESFACVINPMGGYEYSFANMQGDKLLVSFIDPDKNIYINRLSEYGRTSISVELKYVANSDTFTWVNIPKAQYSNRSYFYTRLSPSQTSQWSLFQSTCEQFFKQSKKTNVSEIVTEQLVYEQNDSFIEILQTSNQKSPHSNFCVFNPAANTVLSLPVHLLANRSIVFSTLDLMTSKDRSKFFKAISVKDVIRHVPQSLLALCSETNDDINIDTNFSKIDPFHVEERSYANDDTPAMDVSNDKRDDISYSPFMDQSFEGKPTYTYLVCEYHNLLNGSNGGWEWGEYPRWEWENQSSSCSGMFASNCIKLNGEWARDDSGLGAIGTMFVMDTTSHLESDFSRICNDTNEFSNHQDTRQYVQYYVADSFRSLNHTIWFKKTRTDASSYTLPFNRIVAFGDSLSDNGNLYTATAGLVGKGNYYHGRFSNGPVWVEYFSHKLGIDLYNWAVAAAPSDFGNFFDLFKSVPYTLQHELANFTSTIDELNITEDEISKMLFTLLIGGNNFVHDIKSTPEEISDDYINFTDALVQLGAKYIMVINLPDLAIAPRYNTDNEKSYEIRKRVQTTNDLIEQKIRAYRLEHPEVMFYDINLFKYTDDAMLNPSKYYLKNISDRCYTGGFSESYNAQKICDEPETHLFWDDLHPSTTFGCQTASIAVNILFEKHNIPQTPVDYRGCVASFISNRT